MIPHVHTGSPGDWGWGQVVRHLHDDHDIGIPVVWNLSQVHQTHLMAHQAPAKKQETCDAHYGVGNGRTGWCIRPKGHPEISEDGIGHSEQPIPIQPKPEEAPMPEHHEHDDIVRYHESIARFTLANHLEHTHGLNRQDIDLRDISSQHASLHPMAVAENDADTVEALAKNLYDGDADGPQPDWDDLGQETRDHYRDKARSTLATARGAQRPERVNQPENPSVLVDRLICALTGIDFDQEWVPDNGIGPYGRGVVRRTWIQPAQRLLTWLEHGGALHLAPVASLATDLEREQGLVRDLEDINNTLREQLATTGRQLEDSDLRRQKLFMEMGELRDQLGEVTDERDRAQQALMQKLTEVDELRYKAENRDAVAVELMRVQAQLEEAQAQARHLDQLTSRVQGERVQADRRAYETQKQLERVRQLLTIRTEALATGRLALNALVRDLKKEGWDQSTVFQRLQAIVDGQPEVVTCTVAHLGLATTGDLLAELTARIEVGHTGLDYRTVDHH